MCKKIKHLPDSRPLSVLTFNRNASKAVRRASGFARVIRILHESMGLRKLGAGASVVMLKDRERARNMGKKGRGIVREHFTVERMCERVHPLYLSLLGGKNP